MTCKVVHVVGARPNFVKMAPVYKALSKLNVEQKIVHSGQHYDSKMSGSFFKDLKIPNPDYNLEVMSGTHADQTGKILMGMEKCFLDSKPKIVIVYGDVNTTLAAAISAKKMGIIVAHVESGLRSFDMSMPEEQNRIMVDAISDILFVSEKSGIENLDKFNVYGKVFHVGNTMIDSLSNVAKTNIKKLDHCVVTFHRPSNVDTYENLEKIVCLIESLPCKVKWPVHPRTKKSLIDNSLYNRLYHNTEIEMTEPKSYIEFIDLISRAKFIITDSGGIQEEAVFLKTPCITYRTSTERPATIESGSNTLSMDAAEIKQSVFNIVNDSHKEIIVPELWDGFASQRIAEILQKYF